MFLKPLRTSNKYINFMNKLILYVHISSNTHVEHLKVDHRIVSKRITFTWHRIILTLIIILAFFISLAVFFESASCLKVISQRQLTNIGTLCEESFSSIVLSDERYNMDLRVFSDCVVILVIRFSSLKPLSLFIFLQNRTLFGNYNVYEESDDTDCFYVFLLPHKRFLLI